MRHNPLATQVRQHLLAFLAPLLRTLEHHLDRRLVVTFVETLQALLIWRHRNLRSLPSEVLVRVRAEMAQEQATHSWRKAWSKRQQRAQHAEKLARR